MPQKRTLNVVLLSFGFMLLFVSFQTMSNILDTIITSVKQDNPDYKADAMIGLFIVYITLAVSNFIAPLIVRLLGPRIAMIFGAITYTYIIFANARWPSAETRKTSTSLVLLMYANVMRI